MAILGRFPNIPMLDIVRRSGMDKVAVSRAVNSLVIAGRVVRHVDEIDRRRTVLYLSDAGWDIYGKIVPYAKHIEATMLSEFTEEERATLLSYLDRLSVRVRMMDSWSEPED